jgi:hypothetical protein
MHPIVITMLALLIAVYASAAEYDEGYSAGTSSARSILSEIGGADRINSRIQVPMTSDTGSLTTFQSTYADPVDPGPQDFKAQLTETSSDAFLEVLIQPRLAGDIGTLTVRQDTDFDDAMDASYTSPVIASGVCANGIISCSPGTWYNCRFYRWQANPDSSVYLSEVDGIDDLAGCYCVNAGCGGDLVWANAAYILKDLGGGIVGTIQKRNPDVVVTKVSTDSESIRYYGQRASDAGINQGSAQIYFSGAQHPEQYSDPQGGALPVTEQVLAQQADPSSPYSQLGRAYDARLNPRQEKSCSISHAVSIASSETMVLSTHDTCSALDLSGCVLDREQLCDYENKNCVLTVKDGHASGLSPIFPPVYVTDSDAGLSFAATATGNAISYETDGMNFLLASGPDLWWNIRREYLCDTGVAFHTDDPIDISSVVSGSVEKTGNLISYDEYDPATGATTPQSAGLPEIPAYSDCEMACKVRKRSANTQAGTDANTWDYQNSVTSVQVVYKSCGADQACPVEAGETIVQDCACLNEFPNAVSHMQVMEAAANDMICAP